MADLEARPRWVWYVVGTAKKKQKGGGDRGRASTGDARGLYAASLAAFLSSGQAIESKTLKLEGRDKPKLNYVTAMFTAATVVLCKSITRR